MMSFRRPLLGIFLPVLLLFSMHAKQASAEINPSVVVTESKPLTLVYALESILGFDIRSPLFNRVLCQEGPELGGSISRRDLCESIRFHGIRALDAIRASLRDSSNGPNSVRLQAENVLEEISAQTQELSVLLSTIEKLSGKRASADLKRALNQVDKLVVRDLDPLRSKLQMEAVDRMRVLLTEQRAVHFLADAAQVLGSQWPPIEPIVVALVSVPGKRGTREPTYAHQAGNVVVVEILQDDDLSHRSSVVIHEALHVLWSHRSEAQKKEWDRLCRESSDPRAHLACVLLKEGIPTALGNGLYRWRATGKLPSDEWYADPVLDGFSKAILPVLRQRLRDKKSLDASFLADCVKALVARFPSPERRSSIVFRELSVSAQGDREALRPLIAGVQKNLRPMHLSFVGAVSDSETRNRIFAHPGRSALLFVSPSNRKFLKPYVHLGALEDLLGASGKIEEPSVVTCRHKNGRWYAMVFASTLDQQLKGLQTLKRAKEMPLCGLLE